MIAAVQHIFVCPKRGRPLVSLLSVQAVANSGLVGDRWYRDARTEPLRRAYAAIKGREFGSTNVSIISTGDIARGNARLAELAPDCPPFTPITMRRNIVLESEYDMSQLLGVEFMIGDVRFIGDNLCTPCQLPPHRAGIPHMVDAFNEAFGHTDSKEPNHGGLRARILVGGTIRIGDTITNTFPR